MNSFWIGSLLLVKFHLLLGHFSQIAVAAASVAVAVYFFFLPSTRQKVLIKIHDIVDPVYVSKFRDALDLVISFFFPSPTSRFA